MLELYQQPPRRFNGDKRNQIAMNVATVTCRIQAVVCYADLTIFARALHFLRGGAKISFVDKILNMTDGGGSILPR